MRRRWGLAGAIVVWGVDVAGLLVFGVFVVGITLTDRFAALQSVWWVPREVWAVGYLGLVVLGGVARIILRRTRRGVSKHAMWLWLGLTLVLLVGAVAHKHRVWRVVTASRGQADATLLVWNAFEQNRDVRPDQAQVDRLAPQASIVVISNSWNSGVIDRFANDRQKLRVGRFAVLTDNRVHDWQTLTIDYNVSAAEQDAGAEVIRRSWTGQVARFALRVPELGEEPIELWCVDLPSDPQLPRAMVIRRCVDRINLKWPNAPKPDLVVGDFNIPIGSYSLKQFGFGVRSASDDAGVGFVGTWPRERPFLWIDHIMLGDRFEATAYEQADMGMSPHRAVWAGLKAK